MSLIISNLNPQFSISTSDELQRLNVEWILVLVLVLVDHGGGVGHILVLGGDDPVEVELAGPPGGGAP